MQYDIIFVSGEPFVDHPFSGVGVLKRVLEDKGYSVGVIAVPDWKKDDDFLRLGKPRLFFGVSAGSMDSMLVNYTPMKKKRQDSEFSKMSYRIPDRAVITYCNKLRQLFKDSRIVIGGTESSLRRFAHYDYWDNKLRKSILLDSRADILVYGYGEKQVIEIAGRLSNGENLTGINGSYIIAKEMPKDFVELPSFELVSADKEEFCKMQNMFDSHKKLAQKFDNRYVLQYPAMDYTANDLDYIYSLNYSRKIPENYSEFKGLEFSILTHRGCFGSCNFCSINTDSKQVVSRSKESILEEIKKLTRLPGFNGVIELSGASANMYGMDCSNSIICRNDCMKCARLDRSHKRIIELLRLARKVPGVKKVFIKSGIRHDLAISSEEYLREIIRNHIDKTLMVAPEHLDKEVLKLMNKEDNIYEFIKIFKKLCAEEKKNLKLSYYLMVAHPGCTIKNCRELKAFVQKSRHANFVQVFTPTPMTVSTCMYYTRYDPKAMKKLYVPYTYNEKKLQKNTAVGALPSSPNKMFLKKNVKNRPS